MYRLSYGYRMVLLTTCGHYSTDLHREPHILVSTRIVKGSFDWLYDQVEKSYIAIMNNRGTEQDYTYLRQLPPRQWCTAELAPCRQSGRNGERNK